MRMKNLLVQLTAYCLFSMTKILLTLTLLICFKFEHQKLIGELHELSKNHERNTVFNYLIMRTPLKDLDHAILTMLLLVS